MISDLRRAASQAQLGSNGVAGISVRDANSGAIIFESNADTPLAPASNQKLLTSAAAVMILGPDFTYTTEITPTNDGRVALIGSGDPGFGDPEILEELSPPLDPDSALDAFAAAAAERIESASQLVVDDRVFDRELIHPDWPRDQLERWYCAPVQGVNIHANVIAFYPAPSRGAVSAPTQPQARFIDITDRARVIDDGDNAVWIQRSQNDSEFTIRGSIRTRMQAPIEVSLHEPSLVAGKLIAERLDAAGLEVGDAEPADAVRLVADDEALDLAAQPAARWVTPLDDILYRCNHDSMNLHAEALLKTIGRAVTGEQGSWTNGIAVLRMLLAEMLDPSAVAGTIIRDGSGLSRNNRIAAGTLAAWLVETRRDPDIARMYRETLPTADGKLSRRFRFAGLDNQVHAKTGTINHVRALSGFVTDPETGRAAAFSILCNGLTTGQSVRAAYSLQAAIVEAIDDNMRDLSLPVAPPDANPSTRPASNPAPTTQPEPRPR
ncbi:MAG: D-alanyl-D-alanine carboxypeptidase/D-alanyl-D-alanine-endopeptidase [Planctomycetota bacterium]